MSPHSLAHLEAAYRQARWVMLKHAAFFLVCMILALALRRMVNFPPPALALALLVALVLFGNDLLRFFRCRQELLNARETSR